MKLATRLALAMAALVLLTALAIQTLAYRNIAAIAVPKALERIESQSRMLGVGLDAYVGAALNDVRAASAFEAIGGIVRSSATEGDRAEFDQWRARLANYFSAEMKAKPAYLQFRLVGIAEGGREIVRVDRSGMLGEIRTVPDGELQPEGDRPYFAETVNLPQGRVYVSPIELIREFGEIETPHIATVQVATPVYSGDGNPFGILVINIDLRPEFGRVRSSARNGTQVFVVNHDGYYLVHPDRNLEFGHELGRHHTIRGDFPELGELLAHSRTGSRLVEDEAGVSFGAAWHKITVGFGSNVTIVTLVRHDDVMREATSVRYSSLLGGGVAVVFALAFAVLLARSLATPLVQMTKAVQDFTQRGTVDLPARGAGEIGILGDAFSHMASEVQDKTQALEREVEWRRRMFDTSMDVILVTDRQGNIKEVNSSVVTILGFGPQDMVGHNAAEFIHPDDLELSRNEMRMARLGQASRTFNTRYRHRDGHDVLLEWTGVWSEPEQGHFFIGRDLTEQLVAEDKFRFAVESSPSGIVMADSDGRIVLVNETTKRIFGYAGNELVGQMIDVLVPDWARDRHVAYRDQYVRRPKLRQMGSGMELTARRKDGSELPVQIALNPIQTREGLLVMSMIEDITEKKKADEALRDSERMFRGIIDTSLDAFVQLDERGVIVRWNPQAASMFDRSQDDAVGQGFEMTLLPPSGDEHHSGNFGRAIAAAREGKGGQRFEEVLVRRDGNRLRAEIAISALRQRNDFVFNMFIRDITERSIAEEHLRQAQKMEAVGQLTGGIAHDFNNMLTVITGSIDLLEEGVADRPQLVAITRLIGEAADSGAELTRRLLAFSRRQPLQPRVTDINALIRDTRKLLGRLLGENIEIDVVATKEPVNASIDASGLTTALVNLAINARDAMPDGGKLSLETSNVVLDEQYIRTEADVTAGDYVLITVGDTGSGIPADIRDKVFEPFFSTKATGKGTGLGLSMVYGFVKQSGGHIRIYSEEGHGTTVKIYLPQVAGHSSEAMQPVATPILMGNNETILVVEDDRLVRSSVVSQLESMGYRTIPASSGDEALALVDSGIEFDLLFTDVVMPGGMNGRDLARAIDKRRPGLKVLYTSGYTENTIMHNGRLDPGILLLTKPYRKSDLARMIRTALAGGAPAGDGSGIADAD